MNGTRMALRKRPRHPPDYYGDVCGGGYGWDIPAPLAGSMRDLRRGKQDLWRDSQCKKCHHISRISPHRTWAWQRGRWHVLFAAAMLLWLCAGATMAQLVPRDAGRDKSQAVVCRSVDIRNSVEAFHRLRNCTVVEGFVQIVLIDHATEASFANLTFPHLREITGYLLLYRVNGLRSLGRLFPNLAVIRGETLFLNYALVAFEMIHLQEIGLSALTDILRGSVRIEKNPLLCFSDTVDWDIIAKAGKGEHVLSGNRRRNECPMCPDSLHCPKSRHDQPLCWNLHSCQKVCSERCRGSCTDTGDCCHDFCLGGCNGTDANSCYVCKDVAFGSQCLKKCPPDHYKYLNRRCVSDAECREMPRPRERQHELRPKPYKPFGDSCIIDCPAGYVETEEYHKYNCTPCKGLCRKECAGANIDSIAAAQKMHGCTYIKGSLEIQIRGGKNIVKELEENLSMLEEIEGYLKIVRSFPLISLNFLRHLRVIHGKELDSNKYVFVLLDNQNLQELWDWTTRPENLRILNGRLFFHFNPKLCLYKIEKLKQVANLSDFTDLEVASNSNGDKVACNVTKLNARVGVKTPTAVSVEWDPFDHYDPRTLLGYVVYSMEAPYQNLTLYDGRDACGDDGWRVYDVSVNTTLQFLQPLKPYTQYAFYVKTYTIATERTGAQSDILYFRTLPDTPSAPQILSATSNSSSELLIEWQPPLRPNGNVTHYVITGVWEKDDQNFLDQRDYCNYPLNLPEIKPTHKPPETRGKDVLNSDGTCSCEEKGGAPPKSKENKENAVAAQIQFEDSLQNLIFIKRPAFQNRKKRMVDYSETVTPALESGSQIRSPQVVQSDAVPLFLPQVPRQTGEVTTLDFPKDLKPGQDFRHVVWGATQMIVRNLSHFAQYTVSVQACREILKEEPAHTITNCSTKSIVTVRTLQKDGADNIEKLEVKVNETAPEVTLKWEEPPAPNGIILTYQIEWRRVSVANYHSTPECITRSDYLKATQYTLRNLQPGNYSVRLRATSLAGNGKYTKFYYFYIKESGQKFGLELLVGALIGTFLLIMVFVIVMYLRRRYVPSVPDKLFATVNPEYVSTVYVPDEWEVPRKKVELLRELGQGSFGMVYEGIARDVVEGEPEIRCAIKTVNEHASDRERSEFLNEASVMKAFNTHHVVKLLGVVSQGQPVLVIMELMAHGDLKTYLRQHRPDVTEDAARQPPTLKRILQMAVEIADGMAYLAAKKFVHRDLAARNCMVAEDLTVKIGDFGMTRDIYETDYYRKGTKGLLPVRWMAPESLKDGVFTSYSDVWSYGVVLWEMATLASQPYQGLSNDQVLRYVIDGGVMERPENCPDRLYELMRLCWQHKPTNRPAFLELVSLLLPDVSPSFAQVSFYHSEEGRELRWPQRATEPPQSDDPSTPLRVTRDIEDFSLGSDDEDDPPQRDVEVGLGYHSMSAPIVRHRDILGGSSPPANGKVGNGSAATSPTLGSSAANGWVVGNGSAGGMKTTQC